jgi:type IV secretion system protein VirD4
MLPQELMQLPAGTLIILKASVPPTRAEKIVFYRDKRFTRRQRPAPLQKRLCETAVVGAGTIQVDPRPAMETSDMDYDAIVRRFAAEGCPPPELGASEQEVANWLDRMIDAAARPDLARGADR